MNPVRVARLLRRRAAVAAELAGLERELADELVGPEAAAAPAAPDLAAPANDVPKRRRPGYVPPEAPVSDLDRAKATRVLEGRGYVVRQPRGASR